LAVGVAYCLASSKKTMRIAAASALAATLVVALAPKGWVDEMRSIQETNKGTALSRRFLWTAAFNMWKDRPLLGWGGGNSPYMAGHYQPKNWAGRQYQEMDWSGTAVHSSYFELLAEQGLVGLSIVGYLIVTQFRSLRQTRHAVLRHDPFLREDVELYSRALNGMLVAYLASAAFLSVTYYPHFWYIVSFSSAFDAAFRYEMKSRIAGGIRLPAPLTRHVTRPLSTSGSAG
jgi:O-antigen ligase